MSNFSETLKEALAAAKLSQRQLALATGIDGAALSKVASGTTPPSINVLRKLCAHLCPAIIDGLTRDYAPELIIAYLRDCAAETGLIIENLEIGLKATDPSENRWEAVPLHFEDQALTLAQFAARNEDFAKILASLEPLALRGLGQLVDAEQAALRALPPAK